MPLPAEPSQLLHEFTFLHILTRDSGHLKTYKKYSSFPLLKTSNIKQWMAAAICYHSSCCPLVFWQEGKKWFFALWSLSRCYRMKIRIIVFGEKWECVCVCVFTHACTYHIQTHTCLQSTFVMILLLQALTRIWNCWYTLQNNQPGIAKYWIHLYPYGVII